MQLFYGICIGILVLGLFEYVFIKIELRKHKSIPISDSNSENNKKERDK